MATVEAPPPRRVRPWWTPLLVIVYLSGGHLLTTLVVVAVWPAQDAISGAGLVAVGGAALAAMAIVSGWLILAFSWRSPGRSPWLDALVAAGAGLLVSPLLAALALVAFLQLSG